MQLVMAAPFVQMLRAIHQGDKYPFALNIEWINALLPGFDRLPGSEWADWAVGVCGS